MYLFKKLSLAPLIAVSIAILLPSSLSQPCRDDPLYKFGRQTDSRGRQFTRTCAWLKQASGREFNKWCFGRRFQAHVAVKDKCQVTCGQCTAVKPGCVTYPSNWRDELGKGCGFYESGDNCNIWGGGYPDPRTGYTAQDSCCACGGGCANRPLGWVDSMGNGCDWYAQDPGRSCRRFGATRRNRGFVANDACCVCGGGDFDASSSSSTTTTTTAEISAEE